MVDIQDGLSRLRRKLRKLAEEKSPQTIQVPEHSASGYDLSNVEHLNSNNIVEVIKTLACIIFAKEELISHSLSGKKSSKCINDARPPMDQEKLGKLQTLVRTKCPSVTSKLFTEKMQNLQKVLRRSPLKWLCEIFCPTSSRYLLYIRLIKLSSWNVSAVLLITLTFTIPVVHVERVNNNLCLLYFVHHIFLLTKSCFDNISVLLPASYFIQWGAKNVFLKLFGLT